jgi:hypothetical protein
MNPTDLMKLELERRVAVMPLEFTAWKTAVEKNQEGLGIHRSKLLALDVTVAGLQKTQKALLDKVLTAPSMAELAEAYLKVVDELVGAHDVWRIFRQAMMQHLDAQLRQAVDAADLVAADCYLECLDRAEKWGALPSNEKRPPPLVYLEPAASASTASRGKTLGVLGFPLRRYRDLRLPVPIVLMPSDQVQSLWLYCSLHHEVGHNLDRDLGLSQELQTHLLTRNALAPQHQDTWWEWLAEITADAFGVLLGGAGFVLSLGSLCLMLAPGSKHQELQEKQPHPNPYLRVPLLCTMLESLGISDWAPVTASLREDWERLEKPGWVADYQEDVKSLVELVLETRLAALSGAHCLRDFSSPWTQELERLRKLVDYLRTGLERPDPVPYGITHRLVPVAAQLALFEAKNMTSEKLGQLQTRALAYLHSIRRPEFLAAEDQRTFFQRLVEQLDLRAEA